MQSSAFHLAFRPNGALIASMEHTPIDASETPMRRWPVESRLAATLALLLLGFGYLAGLANLALSVGPDPASVKARYTARPAGEGADLDQAPPVSAEKLAHVAHAHIIPYTLVFAFLAFFIVRFRWRRNVRMGFLILFAASIPMDFLGMAGARFLHPSLYLVIMASGFVFGVSIAIATVWSLYELWLAKVD